VVTLTTAITALDNCTSSEKKENILGALNVGLHFFFLIWNKNMAAHSYLYRRAKIIQIDIMGNDESRNGSVISIKNLKQSLVWEFRLVGLLLAASVIYPFSEEVANGILVSWCLLTLVCHVAFSVIAVKLYLEPVLEALKMGQAVHASKQNKLPIVTQREGKETKDDPDDDEDANAQEDSIHNNGGIDAAGGDLESCNKWEPYDK